MPDCSTVTADDQSAKRVRIDKGGTWARPSGYLRSFAAQRLDPADPDAFRRKIVAFFRSSAADADVLVAGNVQLLGFSEVRESFGDRWPAVKEKVHLLAETVIQGQIRKDDLYVIANDDEIVILFGRDDKRTAEAKAVAIAGEINKRLQGVEVAGAVTVRGVVSEIPRPAEPEALATPQALTAAVADAEDDAERRQLDQFEAMLPALSVSYWPVVNLRKGMISLYEATPRRAGKPVEAPTTDSGQPADTGVFVREIDAFTLSQVGAALATPPRRGYRAPVVVPIHFETLAVKQYRDHYCRACRLLSADTSRRLICYVTDPPPNVPQARLHQLFTVLSPFFRGFMCRFPLDFTGADHLGGLRMIALVADVSSGPGPPATEKALAAFARAAKKLRMRPYLTGAETLQMAAMARRAHFVHLRGAAVSPPVHEPGRVFMMRPD